MNNERRNYPKVALETEANLLVSGVVRSAVVLNLSPSGVQMECRRQLVERMAEQKRASGMYPDFDLEFSLPAIAPEQSWVKSSCSVAHCRRLSQNTYHLDLNFVNLSENDEKRLSEFIHQTATSQ
jgi:c-di-GMP-binding flagellar brake protein YcgR